MQSLLALLLIVVLNLAYSQNDTANNIELRGVWISTVKRLDYPSAANLSSEQLKQEYIRILDSLRQIHINAIFFQVRPAADAFYESTYEPWSEWLTGKQGQPPKPYFDPLKFFIKEAHKRGMQFHAWINPFRAIATIQYADVLPNHISKTHSSWCFDYGLNRYFNPGIPAVRKYIVKIIDDIVRRYDIDGIHFDDYFYPYPQRDDKGHIIPIPDQKTFLKYGNGFKSISNWRRHNITLFIKTVSDSIKAIKPWIAFGVSPCAVWRNKTRDPRGSETRGLAAYDWLYADVLLWDSLKFLDYIAPQLYFNIGNRYADYVTLLNWWSKNVHNADLFIGLNIKGIDITGKNPYWANPTQIPQQIRLARRDDNVKGFILFSSKALLDNPLGIFDTLKNSLFADSTSLPCFPYASCKPLLALDTTPPSIPSRLDYFFLDTTLTILWNIGIDSVAGDLSYYTVYIYKKYRRQKILVDSLITKNLSVKFPIKRGFLFRNTFYIQIKASDTTGNTSDFSNPLKVKFKKLLLRNN